MNPQPETLSIGEVARRTGVNASALRYYERLGLLPAPQRTGGQRRYTPDVLSLVHRIQAAQRAGFSLEEAKMLFSAPEESYARRLQELARHRLSEVEALIASANEKKRILEMGMACLCARPEDCLLLAHIPE